MPIIQKPMGAVAEIAVHRAAACSRRLVRGQGRFARIRQRRDGRMQNVAAFAKTECGTRKRGVSERWSSCVDRFIAMINQ